MTEQSNNNNTATGASSVTTPTRASSVTTGASQSNNNNTGTSQCWIDAAFNTVPIKSISRNPTTGKKKTVFDGKWSKWKTELYTGTLDAEGNRTPNGSVIRVPTPNVGIITDDRIVAVDCDSASAWGTLLTMLSLSPGYADYVMLSKSIGKLDADGNEIECGTAFFSPNTDTSNASSSIKKFQFNGEFNNLQIDLDFQADGALVYAPVHANPTKEPIDLSGEEILDSLKPIPIMVYTWLRSLVDIKASKAEEIRQAKLKVYSQEVSGSARQRPRRANACKSFLNLSDKSKLGEASRVLFRHYNPRECVDVARGDKGFLHPSDVPQGLGTSYMRDIAFMMTQDYSISESLIEETLHAINKCWPNPMDVSTVDGLYRNILDGTNPNYQFNYSTQFEDTDIRYYTDKMEHTIAILAVGKGRIVVNAVTETTQSFAASHQLVDYLDMYTSHVVDDTSAGKMKRLKDMVVHATPVTLVNVVTESWGLTGNKNRHGVREFNQFRRNDIMTELQLLVSCAGDDTSRLVANREDGSLPQSGLYPSDYLNAEGQLDYKFPYWTNKLHQLVMGPHKVWYHNFLRTKLTTDETCAVIIYMTGGAGSGKTSTWDTLRDLVGGNLCHKMTMEEATGRFNQGLSSQLFAFLDELGRQRNNVLYERLKDISGNSTITIEGKGLPTVDETNRLTLVLASNEASPMQYSDDDRRIIRIHQGKNIRYEPWVTELGHVGVDGRRVEGVTELFRRVDAERPDFIRYLAHDCEPCSLSSNVTVEELNTQTLRWETRHRALHTAKSPDVVEEIVRENAVMTHIDLHSQYCMDRGRAHVVRYCFRALTDLTSRTMTSMGKKDVYNYTPGNVDLVHVPVDEAVWLWTRLLQALPLSVAQQLYPVDTITPRYDRYGEVVRIGCVATKAPTHTFYGVGPLAYTMDKTTLSSVFDCIQKIDRDERYPSTINDMLNDCGLMMGYTNQKLWWPYSPRVRRKSIRGGRDWTPKETTLPVPYPQKFYLPGLTSTVEKELTPVMLDYYKDNDADDYTGVTMPPLPPTLD